MKYFNELKKSMEFLSKKDKCIFIGQAVEVPGTAMSNTLKDIKYLSVKSVNALDILSDQKLIISKDALAQLEKNYK